MSRKEALNQFLSQSGWEGATLTPIAGDASTRSYVRLSSVKHGRAILMDADPRIGQNIMRFAQLARWFTDQGLSAPRVFAVDPVAGFAVVEDLGDALFSNLLDRDASLTPMLFDLASDALVHLAQAAPPSHLKPIDPTYVDLAGAAWDWYALSVAGTVNGKAEALATLQRQLDAISAPTAITIHRDWHAGNLLWLPDRKGIARVGILDFQDAVTGHAGYDLVSMTRDARRAVPPEIHTRMVRRFADAMRLDHEVFARDCAVLAVQRNLRILGIFARLCLRFSKVNYVDFIPILWRHLLNDLSHPALTSLRSAVLSSLPEPTPAILEYLKARCGTLPTL